MVEKGIRGGIYHSLHQYVKAINKYMKDYHKNKKGSYLKYWDVNNLHEWALSKKVACKWFEIVWRSFSIQWWFYRSYNEETDEGYFVDVQYPEKLHELYNDLPFLTEGMKICEVEKLVANLHDR